MHVSLAEALEVRGGPLQEEEMWALLNQSAESLQELFRKADPTSFGFIISPWSLLLLPSGSVSFTDENVSHDLRAFTAPEVLQSKPLSSLSDVEKIHVYSLGMTLYWGVDYEVPQSQPIKLGDHLNSILLGMCEDLIYTRVSVRTVLDACSAHIRNSSCAPSFSYVKQLVKLVLGSLSRVALVQTEKLQHNLLGKEAELKKMIDAFCKNTWFEGDYPAVQDLDTHLYGKTIIEIDQLPGNGDKKTQTDRSQAIRERLRGKGLPTGKSTALIRREECKPLVSQNSFLNKGLSKSMGFLATTGVQGGEDFSHFTSSDYNSGQEDTMDAYCPYKFRANYLESKNNQSGEHATKRRVWASSADLLCISDKAANKNFLSGDPHRHGYKSEAISVRTSIFPRSKEARYSDGSMALDAFGPQKLDRMQQISDLSSSSAISSALDRIRERQKKLQVLREAMSVDEPIQVHRSSHSDAYSSTSESPTVISSDPDCRQGRRNEGLKKYESTYGLTGPDDTSQVQRSRHYETPPESALISQELMLKRQEEEIMQLQAKMALRQSRLNLYSGESTKASMLDITRDPLREIAMETAMTQRKLRNFFGPEFVKMTVEPYIILDLPKSILTKKGKNEDTRRKVNIILLSGQRLELTCDTKSTCKDVFDMVVAHIGLVEHHLFALATLKDNEFFFVDPDLKLTKIAPEGWKEEQKKKSRNAVNFNLFFRVKFFVDDVSQIQHSLTCHQYYLQQRKDILEERLHCDDEIALLLASLALQAEYGDYQPEIHGLAYFRMEHYLPARVMEKLNLSLIKEELPKLHSSYIGASEKETELTFLKVCQGLAEYGVHFHRVLPEKKSQTGILMGVCPKGVLIFEVHNGVRTPVLRFPWRETKKISFNKKKISLQNTSDGIKHVFQTDSSKTCQYLLHLCSSQHKFQLQMRARQSNQDTQEIERASLRSLNIQAESVRGFNMGRTISTNSLVSNTMNRLAVRPLSAQGEFLKRLSCSDLSLIQPLPGSTPKETDDRSPWDQRPRVISKSYHDLSRVSLSPQRKVFGASMDSPPHVVQELMGKAFQSVTKSDTESVIGFGKINNSRSLGNLNRSHEIRKQESDSSSMEDTGQAYVVGVSMFSASNPTSPLYLKGNDAVPKKPNLASSPEREITLVHLKKDAKYGLGFQIVGGENTGKLDLGIFVSSVTPGGPADVGGSLKPGDRLISVNSVSLEGVSHYAALQILDNSPEDVTLVVSQPKDKFAKVSLDPVHLHNGTKGYSRSSSLMQDNEVELSSEEHSKSRIYQRLISGSSSGGNREGSLSSQDSRTESASLSQSHINGLFSNHVSDRTLQSQFHGKASPAELSKISEKKKASADNNKGKGKKLGLKESMDSSDRGDSDMDEATYSSSQEHQSTKKDSSSVSMKMNSRKHSTAPLKPGDIFKVELVKKDSSLGISVTGGVNTSVRHGGIYVKAIIPNGAAEHDGRIHKGDRVLSVNGSSLEGATHKQAVEALRNTGQVVALLLEKGQLPVARVHAPVTPQSTPPNQVIPSQPQEKQTKKITNTKDYSFATDENMFEVRLLKNSSGLGFSFCRQENLTPEQQDSSIVRVRKLFPGQPAAESGQMKIGDVILKVNGASLKGVSQQEVISALRGTSPDVTLLLCRPLPGVLPDISPALVSLNSPTQLLPEINLKSVRPVHSPQEDQEKSPNENDVADNSKKRMKSPSRRDSYSDSSGTGEEDLIATPTEVTSHVWNSTLYQTPGNVLSQSQCQYETLSSQEETIRTSYYTPHQSPSKPEFEDSNPPSPLPLDMTPEQHCKLQLEFTTPSQLDDTYLSTASQSIPHQAVMFPVHNQCDKETEEFEPEVDLHVTMTKSEQGSLGFTVTKANDNVGCYIHDIIQDPAKSDGRLQPGDRLIKVNDTDVTNMSHTDAVNLLRAAPKTVKLVLGRILEIPKVQLLPQLLHDITLPCHKQELGLTLSGGCNSLYQVIYISEINPESVAACEGSLRPLDIIHYINGASTLQMTLKEAKRALEMSLPIVILKATREGHPVLPKFRGSETASPKSNKSAKDHGHHHGDQSSKTEVFPEDCITEVNGERMIGVSHTKAVASIQNVQGLPTNDYINQSSVFSKYNGDIGTEVQSEDSNDDDNDQNEVIQSLLNVVHEETQNLLLSNHNNANLRDHLSGTNRKPAEDKAEDTDCDDSSLPDDSPELTKINGCGEYFEDKHVPKRFPPKYLTKEQDETTMGNFLSVKPLNHEDQDRGCLLMTNEQLSTLPLVTVLPSGNYTGSSLKSVIRLLHGLLNQGVPSKEFENLQDLKPLDQCLVGQTKENRKKNRYKNILPYDTTRVPLGEDDGYINASFIKIPIGNEEFVYIACQGPLPTTVTDFWQMVWEQNCTVITMMTQEVEGGKIKCQRYWPDAADRPKMIDNQLQLTLLKTHLLENFIVRLLALSNVQTGEVRNIIHLNFTAWPDHETPSQPDQLLTFISYMRHIYKSGPIITHCSAGIGRSGTLICIDAMLGLISRDLQFDISDLVRTMRLQRHGMVQTEEQYVFCYQVILCVFKTSPH